MGSATRHFAHEHPSIQSPKEFISRRPPNVNVVDLSQVERRLAAIMFTDMAGYTTLTQANESTAMEVLAAHNRFLRPIFSKHHGREIKTIGDSFLIEFDSAQDAALCAVEIQRLLHDYNSSSKDESRINLRIGIHLGDVIHRENDVFGDAVNIASRIETVAEVGGVCISEQVYDQIRNKFDSPMIKLDQKELKNIQYSIDVYKIAMPWEKSETASIGQADYGRRLAVLPLVNMSPDPNDAFFADGLTEELITELSLIKELRVIARTSIMHYKNVDKSIMQVGKELRVGHVLEGSVRKSGNKIRITVQLIDAANEEHLWADRYDRQMDDVFAIQSEIATNVAKNLQVKLVSVKELERKKQPTAQIEAYTLYLKGRFLWNKRTNEGVNDALKAFEKAIVMDPNFAQAYSGVADCYSILIDRDEIPITEGYIKAQDASIKALEINNNLPEAHASFGLVLERDLQFDRATLEFKKAIELNPSYASAHHWYSLLLLTLGRFNEALAEMLKAEEADPLSPVIASNVGLFYWTEGKDELALQEWGKALEMERGFSPSHVFRSLFYVSKGMRDEALAELKLLEGSSDRSMVSFAGLGFAYGLLGMKEEAVRILEKLLEENRKGKVSAGLISQVYAGLEDHDRFYEWAFRAVEDRSILVGFLRYAPLLEGLRSDPRFEELLKRAKVPV